MRAILSNYPSSTFLKGLVIGHRRYVCGTADIEYFIEKLRKLGEGDVTLSKDDNSGISVVTLNNSKKKNAMSPRMMVRFSEVTAELRNWEAGKAVILRGVDGSLCSGGDLVAVMRDIGTPSDGRMMCEFMQKTLMDFYNLPFVSVAAVEGKAVGGGAELTTACDVRLMKPDAAIGFVHKKMAVSSGWGGTTRLVGIVGRRKALDIIQSAKLISCSKAMEMSLADGILDANRDCVEVCKEWLTEQGYLDGHPLLIQAAKRAIVSASSLPVQESLIAEKEIFSSLWGSKLHKEALAKGLKHR